MKNNETVNNTEVTAEQKPEVKKDGVMKKFVAGYHRFRATKVGTWTIRGTKAAAILAACGLSYKAGTKHANQTVVTITPIESGEEPAEEEIPEEEPVNEEV